MIIVHLITCVQHKTHCLRKIWSFIDVVFYAVTSVLYKGFICSVSYLVRMLFTSFVETGALNFTCPISNSFESDSTCKRVTTITVCVKATRIYSIPLPHFLQFQLYYNSLGIKYTVIPNIFIKSKFDTNFKFTLLVTRY
jgi:hypothetical protein